MKRFVGFASSVVLCGALGFTGTYAQSADPRIEEAVQPLPDDLRAGATVVAYDAGTGERKVLRQGTNALECQPKAADGFTRCYNKALGPRRDLEAKLHAQFLRTPGEVEDFFRLRRQVLQF